MWNLSRHHGPTLTSDEFVEAIRIRLGAAGPAEPIPCGRCGAMLLDSAGSHAACCSTAEGTRGHYKVSNLMWTAASQCDPSAETETPGLIPGTDLRPADVLTTALGNGTTALDVGIASPDSRHAGRDCTQTMLDAKVRKYSPHFGVLDQQNIEYKPVIWSSYGRPHAQTLSVLRTLSRRISRRRNVGSAAQVFQQLHGAISVEIWRKGALQVFSCWPARADNLFHDGDYDMG